MDKITQIAEKWSPGYGTLFYPSVRAVSQRSNSNYILWHVCRLHLKIKRESGIGLDIAAGGHSIPRLRSLTPCGSGCRVGRAGAVSDAYGAGQRSLPPLLPPRQEKLLKRRIFFSGSRRGRVGRSQSERGDGRQRRQCGRCLVMSDASPCVCDNNLAPSASAPWP